jgi:hypothetical protein
MQKRFILGVATAAFLFGGAANASTIVHDTVGEFSAIVPGQLLQANGLAVAADRSVIGNMFDNNLSTIWSPGIGGRISFVIAPTSNVLTSGAVIELTNVSSNHREQAQVYLGVDNVDGSYVLIGTLLNAEFPGGASVVNSNPTVATLDLVVSGLNSSYTLTINSGAFNSLRIVDISSPTGGGNRDGFDIAELEVTSRAPEPVVGVPAPASLALFGAGLLGLASLRRRR